MKPCKYRFYGVAAPLVFAALLFSAVAMAQPAPEADWSIDVSESVDPVVAGSGSGNLLHQLTVTNNGPGTVPAGGVTLEWTVTWPAGVSLTSYIPPANTNCPASLPSEDPGSTPGLELQEGSAGTTSSPYTATGITTTFEASPGEFATACFYFTVSLQAAEDTDVITTTTSITDTELVDPDDTNDSDSEATSIRWPTATFRVSKEYTSGDGGPVDVTLECTDGTGLLEYDPQSGTTQTSLTVRRFDTTASCTVTEQNVPDAYYTAARSEGCDVDPISDQGSYACTLTNAPTRVTFTVQKLFMDGNDSQDVELNISCNTGLPLEQSKTAQLVPGPLGSPQTYEVEFVVTEFDNGELDCTVWETPVAGYLSSYNCDIDVGGTCDTGGPSNIYAGTDYEDLDPFFEGPCVYEDVTPGAGPDEKNWDTLCVIRNYPAPVEVQIDKEWVLAGGDIDGVSTDYTIQLTCDSPVIDADYELPESVAENGQNGSQTWYALFEAHGAGPIDVSWFATVIPDYPATKCTVDEDVYDPAVEVDNGCGDSKYHAFELSVGNGYACTITNTVFFEGIPTLNQYGKLLLALLMLGVGFVACRRLV